MQEENESIDWGQLHYYSEGDDVYPSIGTLSDDEDDDSENITKKMNLRP